MLIEEAQLYDMSTLHIMLQFTNNLTLDKDGNTVPATGMHNDSNKLNLVRKTPLQAAQHRLQSIGTDNTGLKEWLQQIMEILQDKE